MTAPIRAARSRPGRAAVPSPDPARQRRGVRRRGRRMWLWAAVTYRIWNASLRVPLYQDQSDARLIANLVKNTPTRAGGPDQPASRGAVRPGAVRLPPRRRDLAVASSSRDLSLFINDYGLVMNIYYFTGFGVTAARRLPRAAPPALRFWAWPWCPPPPSPSSRSASATASPTSSAARTGTRRCRPLRAALGDALARAVPGRPRPAVGSGPVGDAGRTCATTSGRRRVADLSPCACCSPGTETMTTAFTLVLLALTGLIAALRQREPAPLLVSGRADRRVGRHLPRPDVPDAALRPPTAPTNVPPAAR